MSPPRLVQVGVFGAPHGVRGEVRVKTFTGDPLALADYGALTDSAGKTRYEIASLRPVKAEMVVVRVKGVDSREAAEALTGVGLFASRDALPVTEGEDEFYHADLIGLSVETASGETIGEVATIANFGADDLVEVRLAGVKRTVYLPFTKAVVPTIDLAGGRIVVDPPAGALDAPGKSEGDVS